MSTELFAPRTSSTPQTLRLNAEFCHEFQDVGCLDLSGLCPGLEE